MCFRKGKQPNSKKLTVFLKAYVGSFDKPYEMG